MLFAVALPALASLASPGSLQVGFDSLSLLSRAVLGV